MISRRILLLNSLAVLAASIKPTRLIASEQNIVTLTARKSKAQLLEEPKVETDVWAYDGSVPGPVLHVKKGEEISINFINHLDQPTSIHWHGIRINNAMDGVSFLTQQPVMPGEEFVYRFTPPDAGTYWYHPHNRTWEQLARGLYGTLIVSGDESTPVDKDFPIVVDDWRLDEAGLIHEASLGSIRDWSHAGRLGNILTLNGKPYERLEVSDGQRIRLRFINTSNARVMRFAVTDQDNWLVGLDGQAIPPTLLDIKGITLAPAQRADVIIDINGKVDDEFPIMETSGTENLVAGYLVCKDSKVAKTKHISPPTPLISNNIPEPNLENAVDLKLNMTGGAMQFLSSATFKGDKLDGRELALKHNQVWAFNGMAGMSSEPFFRVKSNQTVKLKIVNETLWPHSIHLHGHHFRILHRQQQKRSASNQAQGYEANAFRDTVLIERDETVEIAFVADNLGKWMLHCHMLEHQAAGMATWFEVI